MLENIQYTINVIVCFTLCLIFYVIIKVMFIREGEADRPPSLGNYYLGFYVSVVLPQIININLGESLFTISFSRSNGNIENLQVLFYIPCNKTGPSPVFLFIRLETRFYYNVYIFSTLR